MIKTTIKKVWMMLLGISMTLPVFSQYNSECSELIWHDEFDGTSLDGSKWSYQIGDGCDINLCGWGNSELEYYTDRPQNVSVQNGKLSITAIRENYMGSQYTSGRILTAHKADFVYGRFEARIKMPQGEGLWPAFWLLPTDNVYGAWAASGEIDIVEYLGGQTTMSTGTAHYGGTFPNNKFSGKAYYLPNGQNFYDDFHVFAVEWDSTQIKWFVDGVQFHSFPYTKATPYKYPFDQKFHIILNQAVGGNLPGDPTNTPFPNTMEVDYVRVYSLPFSQRVSGKQTVFAGSTDVDYSIKNDSTGYSYIWKVPADATITEGQGTKKIKVSWGKTGGEVYLRTYKTSNDTCFIHYPVTVFSDTSCTLTYQDFDGNDHLYFTSCAGKYSIGANPSANAINGSSNCAGYVRPSSNPNDSIAYKNFVIEDPAEFESGNKVFYLDVFSNLPSGSKIQLQMISSGKLVGTTTSGRRNTFTATTSLRNQWERLMFKFTSVNDASVTKDEIDYLVFYINPGNAGSSVVYFDNFKRGRIPVKEIVGEDTVSCNSAGQLYNIVSSSSSTYNWTVAPSDAVIASGRNSDQVSINWGGTSGYINLFETDSKGCQQLSGSFLTVVKSCSTAVSTSIDQYSSLNVYPNPVHNTITLEGQFEQTSGVTIIILNTMGEELSRNFYSGVSGDFMESINVQKLNAGAYFVKVLSDKGSIFRKFVKQ